MVSRPTTTTLVLGPGEVAWRCDAVRVGDDGRVSGVVAFDEATSTTLRSHARRLYLDVIDRGDGGVWLVHREGWPFDLRTLDADPAGRAAAELRPTGSGDEVMRDLIDSFERDAPGHTLHVRALS